MLSSKSVLALVLLLTSNCCFADVTTQPLENTDHLTIRISGYISRDDVYDFQASVSKLKKSGKTLHMNSIVLEADGGDSASARAIGRYIRKNNLNTYVGPNGSCASACVDIVLGGVIRMVYGKLYIHRGHFTSDLTEDRLRELVPRQIADTKDYIEEMGIRSSLTDAINSTPNLTPRKLEQSEVLRWNIHGMNRLEEEIFFRRAARQAGLTLSNFNKLYMESRDRCANEAMQFQRTMLDCVVQVSKEG